MSEFDREKWNKKFETMPDLLAPREPSSLVKKFYTKAPGKKALDLACGGGRHTFFLSQKGFSVDSVDISKVALYKLKPKVDESLVNLIEHDLDSYAITKAYDFIVKTNYLDRALIDRAKQKLSLNGILVIETYMKDPKNEKKDSNPDFLLEKEELKTFFDDHFEILQYTEFWNESYEKYRMMKQGIAVKRLKV